MTDSPCVQRVWAPHGTRRRSPSRPFPLFPSQNAMHELSIVEALIEQVQKEVERSGQTGRIRRLDLTVGRLSGVSCDSLRFAFELLSAETIVEQAELHITQPKAICRCLSCQAQAEVDDIPVRCPACGDTQVTLEGGRQLLLESIEMED